MYCKKTKQIKYEDDQIINQRENEPESVTNQNECSHSKLLADSSDRNITIQ